MATNFTAFAIFEVGNVAAERHAERRPRDVRRRSGSGSTAMSDDEARPISPRSPRAALEPEQLPPPPKRSRGRAQSAGHRRQCALHDRAAARMLGAGGGYFYRQAALRARRARSPTTRSSISRARAGTARHRRAAAARGRDRRSRPVRASMSAACSALKARTAEGRRISCSRSARACATSSTRSSQGKVVQHALTIPEGLTTEQIVARLLRKRRA